MVLPGGLAHGGQRQRQALRGVSQLHAGQRVLAGAQRLLRVGQLDGHADRSGAGFGGRRDAGQLAGHGIGHPFDRDPDWHPGRELRHLMRAHAAGQLEPGQVDNGQHRLLRAQLLAGHDMPPGDHAGNRGHDLGVARGQAHRVELGRRGARLGTGGVQRRLRLLQGDRRDELLVGQALVAGVGALGLRHAGARRLEQGVALGQAAGQVGAVDRAQHLACAYAAALGNAQRQQGAGGLGAHDRRSRRHQRPGELDHRRHAGQQRRHHLARRELQRHLRFGVLVLLARGARLGDHRHRSRDPGQRQHHRRPDPPSLAHLLSFGALLS